MEFKVNEWDFCQLMVNVQNNTINVQNNTINFLLNFIWPITYKNSHMCNLTEIKTKVNKY